MHECCSKLEVFRCKGCVARVGRCHQVIRHGCIQVWEPLQVVDQARAAQPVVVEATALHPAYVRRSVGSAILASQLRFEELGRAQCFHPLLRLSMIALTGSGRSLRTTLAGRDLPESVRAIIDKLNSSKALAPAQLFKQILKTFSRMLDEGLWPQPPPAELPSPGQLPAEVPQPGCTHA